MDINVDTELFIAAVKNQPVIWDTTSEHYHDRIKKRGAWFIVCEEFFEGFNEKSDKEKNEIGMTTKKSALFICLGNICRSPIAAAVFRQAVKDRGEEDKWVVESAALGSWHVGNPADYRAQETLKSHNVDHTHSARQITKADFNTFDYIFGMDDENMKALARKAPEGCKAKVLLLISFDPKGDKTIRDPYYDSDSEGFETCYQQCVRACNGFLDSLSK